MVKHIANWRPLLMMAALLIAFPTLLFSQTPSDSTTVSKKKERKVSLYGEVYDSFTKAVVKAHLTLLRTDSTVVDTTTCMVWGTTSFYELKVAAQPAEFIIKATADGYEDTFMNYHLRHIARNSSFELPRLLMKKKNDVWREYDLDGVEVKGTKVKIAYRGDTIVYNASAFNLPEGSMLDGLIRQMPGAELKENGDIYVNGRKIDNLTLNGKDFFKGQNKVMLDNLPYFTVKELKVYDKSTKRSEMVGHDIEAKEYVMDVQLKREYNRGYLGNVEIGGGTEKRYMGRLFALYYDDHSRVSVFGNLNNVNETRRPGGEGDWQPSNMPQGLRTTKQTGLSLTTENKDKHMEESFDATLEWSDADNWTRSTRETFASEGNILGGSESHRRQKDFRMNIRNDFRIEKPIQFYSGFYINLTNGDMHSTQQDSTYRQYVINQTQNIGYNKYRTLNTSGNIGCYKKFEWGDYLSFSASGSYNQQKPSQSFSRNNTYYETTGTSDLRDYHTDTHGDSYNYSLNGSYTLQFPNQWYASTTIGYNQSVNNTHNSNYRLDWLGSMPSNTSRGEGDIYHADHLPGWLPSTYETLEQVLDSENSDSHFHFNRIYTSSLGIHHSTDNNYFSLDLTWTNNHERMHYIKSTLDTIAKRKYNLINPSIYYYNFRGKKGLRYIYYMFNQSQPDFASLMPTDNTTNPLARRINNPNLKGITTHSIAARYEANVDSLKRFFSITSNVSISQNSWGTRTTYDATTGAYTYENANINGNWNATLGTSYQQPLDKKKLLTLRQRAEANYQHSVDFDINYDAVNEGRKSTVHNWTFNEHLDLDYQKDKFTASIMGDVSWRIATSDRTNFERISTFDFRYGGRATYTIPWLKVTVATDLTMFCKRGYESSIMNTDDLVWNAMLTRSLWKEKLTLKLTAFDLLHQLSSKQYSVNAQGRTETWTNCIPRYVMLSMTYKLTKKPKKN